LQAVLERLKKEIGQTPGEVRVSIRADRQLPIEIIKNTTLELQGLEGRINAGRGKADQVRFHIAGEVRAPAN
jgi:hypothetical protein